MSYSAIQHNWRLVAKHARGYLRMRHMRINVDVDRTATGKFAARACVPPTREFSNNLPWPSKRCAWGAHSKSPTAAVKSALRKLATQLK